MMTFLNMDPRSSSQVFSRNNYLTVVRAGLMAGNYRYAREAAMGWLAEFPGDLTAGLLFARALIGEEKFSQALPILQGLCMADVEFLEAAQELFQLQSALIQRGLVEPNNEQSQIEQAIPTRRNVFAPGMPVQAYYFALTGQAEDIDELPVWASDLWLARQYLEQKQFSQAEQSIRLVLSLQASHPLIAVTHLRYLSENQKVNNLENRQKIAVRYHQAFPDNLACILFYADWLLESGDSSRAVALLHQSAARDIAGKVPASLWGESHPYLPLWPEKMQMEFRQSIPADVARLLGWNQLPDQILAEYSVPNMDHEEILPWEDAPEQRSDLQIESLSENSDHQDADDSEPELPQDLEILDNENVSKVDDPTSEADLNDENIDLVTDKANTEDIFVVKQELERLAKRFRLPGLTNQDGRYPIYIILSIRKKLEALYGVQVAGVVLEEMDRLAEAVSANKRWGARVILADDEASLKILGLTPVESGTAWNVKLMLSDLDSALSKRGEMIGAVLIVGGPEVVPFHLLPNPVDDQDNDVPSDNPYATRDENYFLPEWPIGRLPGGSGDDASLLLAMLRRFAKNHQINNYPKPWYRRLWHLFTPNNKKQAGFGYTAAVWRHAAENVFRPIGEPKALNSSPPLGLSDLTVEKKKQNGKGEQIPALKAPLAYFNLHGLEDAAEWYGQRDPLDPQDGPDYPVALRPKDIRGNGRFGRKLPQFVFSEACYGLHILGRKIDNAISLKFLEAGSTAVVGSTCMAYGSIDAPLVAADLLGYAFWKYFREGLPVGEAFRQAKIQMAKIMHKRQGYLDGEDQKTIISFVLYGDPMASIDVLRSQHKTIRRTSDSVPQVMTVCDRTDGSCGEQEIPTDVMDSVRQVVSQYLPGMANAQIVYSTQRTISESDAHSHPEDQDADAIEMTSGKKEGAHKKSSLKEKPEKTSSLRRFVTLSKQVPNTHGVHAQVAKLTLDDQGKLVKLVVSR